MVSDNATNKHIIDTCSIEEDTDEPMAFTDQNNCAVPLILPSGDDHNFVPVQNVIIEDYVLTSTENIIYVQNKIFTPDEENMQVENNIIPVVENIQIQTTISEPEAMQDQDLVSTEKDSNVCNLTKLGKIRQRKSKDMNKVNPKQKQKAKHPVRTACDCKKKCTKKISELRRELINSQFWDMSWMERRLYVLKCCLRKPVKRRTLGEITARKNSIVYTLDGERNESHIVCKTFFLTTLGFTKNNNTLLKNLLGANYESNNILPKKDMRGKLSHKTQIEERQLIKLHVESYHPSISHYRREHAPLRRYLPSDISIKDMYSNFLVQNPLIKCSYERYRLIVSKMNISFAKLGHEECEQCEHFSQHDPEHKKDALNPDCNNCSLWEAHINRAREARESYRRDVKRAESPNNHIGFFSVDLQKVIMLPRIDTFKSVCFTKRIVAFNESFVPLAGKKQHGMKPLAVIWHEGIAGRSKEDIISAFYAFFRSYRDVEHIVLWLDNCAAQNKNWALFSFLIFIVNSDDISLNTLELHFFEPGHTFMSADSFHHQVELAMKRKGKLYDFSDFQEAVRECHSRKVDVKSMEPKDFFEWRDYTSQYKLKKQNPRPYLNDIVQVIARRGDYNLLYRNDSCGPVGPLLQLNFLTNKAYKEGIQIPPSRLSYRGIDKDKKNGILTKLVPLMPDNRKQFWRDIPVNDVPDLNTSIED